MEISKTEIVAYSKTEQALAELRTKYEAVVFDVTSTKGMGAAKEARSELRSYRVDLEKVRVLEKAESLAYGRLVDSEARRIAVELEKLEDPIDSMIKAEEKRKADEKAERERIEKERVDTIRARIGNIERWPLRCIGMSSENLGQQLFHLADEDKKITDELYMELKAEAMKAVSLAQDQIMIMAVAKKEEEEKAETQILEAIRLEELRKADEEIIRKELNERMVRIEEERIAKEIARGIEIERINREMVEERIRQISENDRVSAELKAQKDKIDQERKEEKQRLEIERQNLASKRAAEEEELAIIRAELEAEKARLKSFADEESKQFHGLTNAEADSLANDEFKILRLQEFQEEGFVTKTERNMFEPEELTEDRLKTAQEEWMVSNGPAIGRPSDMEIVKILADHYQVSKLKVLGWLITMELSETEEELYAQQELL